MPYLTRENILQIDDLLYEDVEVPEWGGTVRVRGLTGSERDSFEAEIVQLPQNPERRPKGARPRIKMENFRAKLVARSVVDEDGQRLFSDKDVAALGQKSAAALDRVFAVAQRLSGLSDQDVEELVENFESGQSDGSTLS